jgi:hypothetical protein
MRKTMSLRSNAVLVLLLAGGLSAGCKSFSFEAEAADLSKIKTAFVIIAEKGKLQGEAADLVGPDTQGKYSFFAQFLSGEGGAGWELVKPTEGLPLVPEVDENTISLDVSGATIEALPGAEIALLVRFSDGHWVQKSAPLVAKGEVRYTIGDATLVLRP